MSHTFYNEYRQFDVVPAQIRSRISLSLTDPAGWTSQQQHNYKHKKVLLRERKRHTAYPVLIGGGGYPYPVLTGRGGTPSSLDQGRGGGGAPIQSRWGEGYPIQSQWGVPPIRKNGYLPIRKDGASPPIKT